MLLGVAERKKKRASKLCLLQGKDEGAEEITLEAVLIKNNHLFIGKDENALTGCKAKSISFSGFVRLVPKMMNPVLMPAEWSALSKLKDRGEVQTCHWHRARTKANTEQKKYIYTIFFFSLKCFTRNEVFSKHVFKKPNGELTLK